MQFEKDGHSEFCFVVWWEDEFLKKVCVSVDSLDQSMPDAELIPLTRVMFCLDHPQFPLCVCGATPTLVGVLSDARSDGKHFVTHERFTSEIFLDCFRRVHQTIFGMLEIVMVVEYIVLWMPNALH